MASTTRPTVPRRARGFEPAGSGDPLESIVPRKLGRELSLALLWREVAGAELCRRARAASVARGVLSVELLVDDAGWERTLDAVLPVLAARVAAARPDWRISRCRLFPSGFAGRRPPQARPVAEVADLPRAAAPPRPPEPVTEARARSGPREVMERYLERAALRSRGRA